LTYTLVSDGASDRALIPVLTWALRRQGYDGPVNPQWADLRRLKSPPSNLGLRVQWSVELYPCDLLFIHRDAEGQPLAEREQEIIRAVQTVNAKILAPFVPVVPIRMMEAWLLIEEDAIRSAAGNPNGDNELDLPIVSRLENLPNPKSVLHNLIREASGLGAHRRQHLKVGQLVYRIADLVNDFSPLENIPAFARFSAELRQVLRDNGFCPVVE
jgi:hypothetical protein